MLPVLREKAAYMLHSFRELPADWLGEREAVLYSTLQSSWFWALKGIVFLLFSFSY